MIRVIKLLSYFFVQDIVKNLRDNWNSVKNANEDILKKSSVTSIEVKKGKIFQKFYYIIFILNCLSKKINTPLKIKYSLCRIIYIL